MSEGKTDGLLIQKNGKPLYFLADKRIPVEQFRGEIQPFDEADYAIGLSHFILEHVTDYPLRPNVVVNAYRSDSQQVFNLVLKHIVSLETGLPEEEVALVPRSQIVTFLYELGCPQLFAMHKTARITSKYATEQFRFGKKNFVANPLNQPFIMVATDFRLLPTYRREFEEDPYLIAIPLESVLKSRELSKSPLVNSDPASLFGETFFEIENLDPADFLELTEKIRIYTPDRDYDAYDAAMNKGIATLENNLL